MQNDPNLRVQGSAIRSGDYKFINNKQVNALYNLKKEVSETSNLKKNNKIYDSLINKFQIWNASLRDPIFLGLMANDQYNKLNPDRFEY